MNNQKNLLTIEVGSGIKSALASDEISYTTQQSTAASVAKEHSQREEIVVIQGSITVSP